jgi:hypothetical protein
MVKAEHKRPAGLLKPLEIPEWKWEHITMDFVVGLPCTPRGKDAIWVVVERLTKSAHFIPMKTTNSAEELVPLYMKEVLRLHGVPKSIVSPTKGIVRFGATGKLSPRYIGPFVIIARVGRLAYRLQLPESMKGVHNLFHVSMLRKYFLDPEHKIDLESITVQQDLTLECHPVRILESSERVMRRTIK